MHSKVEYSPQRKNMNITLMSLAKSTIFRKLPLELIEAIISHTSILEAMNRYTKERFNDVFWYGGTHFNSDYRIVCSPTGFDFVGFWPFMVKTIHLERTPFTPGVDSAKFALHPKFDKPLLID